MRRLLSIALVALFSLSLISPLFALDGGLESNLPACCRRNGAHQCAMSAGDVAVLAGKTVASVRGRCADFPSPVKALHIPQGAANWSSSKVAEVLRHQFEAVASDSWVRIPFQGARHKRGPPAPIPS